MLVADDRRAAQYHLLLAVRLGVDRRNPRLLGENCVLSKLNLVRALDVIAISFAKFE